MQRRPDDDNDAKLLQRASAGEEDAFVALYRKFSRPVFRFAARMTGDDTTAEEVVQEVFMTLVRQSGAYDRARGGVGPWLLGIARNHVLRAFGQRTDEVFDEADRQTEPADSGVQDALSVLIEREDHDALRAAILTLPAPYREALVLCDLEELDYKDAASVTRCSIGTIRSRLHRARNLLASKLGMSKRRGCTV